MNSKKIDKVVNEIETGYDHHYPLVYRSTVTMALGWMLAECIMRLERGENLEDIKPDELIKRAYADLGMNFNR